MTCKQRPPLGNSHLCLMLFCISHPFLCASSAPSFVWFWFIGITASLFYPWRLRPWRHSETDSYWTFLLSSSVQSTVYFCCIVISEVLISRWIICIGYTFSVWGFQSLIAFLRLLFSSSTFVFSTARCMATLHCTVILLPEHIFILDWLLSRFYSYALHSVFFRIILLNIFVDAVLKTWFLESDWSYLQAWYSWLISCWSLQFSHSVGSHAFWASLWYARGIKRLEVAGLWSSKLVSLVRCNPCHFFPLTSIFRQVGFCPFSSTWRLQLSVIIGMSSECLWCCFHAIGFIQRAACSHFTIEWQYLVG